jgi:ABC-type sulfate/molybdate transport systems ATPase subunit
VPLEIQIAKALADFALDVSFTTGNSPLSILGPSGAGKSMLLRCIAGLEHPDRGRIVLNDRVLFDSEKSLQLPARERRVGMLFQHYGLFPHYTLGENIAFGLRHLPDDERRRRVEALLERAHIAGLENRYPREVSGGEQQRAALARALAIEPEALLLDEPLSALDTHLRSQMEAQLQEAFEQYAQPALLVTHNIEEAYRLGEQLLVLSRGKVAAFGSKDNIFLNPPSMEVARLTGCKNFSRARAIDGHHIEAVDWNCRLLVSRDVAGSHAYAGIRAHHIHFVESNGDAGTGENIFPGWLVRASETPFRVTLYLHLHQPPGRGGEYHLQAEVTKEKWKRLRDRPLPWQASLSADAIFLVRE